MSRPIVLLDVDEVLADFVGEILKLARKFTNRNQFRDDITQWDISAALGHSSVEKKLIWDRVKEEGFCYQLEPIPGAIAGVKALQEFCDVRAVTSPFPSKTWASERESWLCDIFGFDRHNIVQTPGKSIVFGDVLVDDKYETVRGWQDQWPVSTAVLLSAPWNRARGWVGPTTTGWPHIVSLIEELV